MASWTNVSLLAAVMALVFVGGVSATPKSSLGTVDDSPETIAKKKPKKLSNSAIAKILIKESIARYPGTCACPYNRTRRGRKCGRRSAYSKPGGYSPLCYKRDVTKDMIKAYRTRTRSGR